MCVREKKRETSLITLEVGSRGVINPAGFQLLKGTLNITTRDMSELLLESCKRVIEGSYSIWCSRNRSVTCVNSYLL